MAEERITTVEGEAAPTTHTTIIHDGEPRGGSGVGILLAVVLLIAVVAGIYLFSQSTLSTTAKNNAIASAASDVGSAAKKVGNAAEDAADKATN